MKIGTAAHRPAGPEAFIFATRGEAAPGGRWADEGELGSWPRNGQLDERVSHGMLEAVCSG